MKVKKIIKISFMAALGFVLPLSSKEIPRTEYIKYLPISYPKIMSQTEANAIFRLYGDKNDPTYRDTDPVDGIDDQRFMVLQELALRFAPYLVQNTSDAPMDFKYFANIDKSFPLYADTWDLSSEIPRLAHSESIDIYSDDSRLLSLINEFRPDRSSENLLSEIIRNPGVEYFKVLYFDFPGQDEKSWREKYRIELLKLQKKTTRGFVKTYVHMFITDESAKSSDSFGYEYVIQYWFFYPHNDGGNNHEGDWEHINVVISPINMVKNFLSESDIQRILQGSGLAGDRDGEALVIKRLEYYFHYKVMILDFSQPNVYALKDEWNQEIKALKKTRRGEAWIWEKIRSMAYRDSKESEINTHPFGYIGGDCRGYEQILSAPGGKNRNSHGNYPFPGVYREVGPGNSSEKISNHIDHRDYFKSPSSKKAEGSNQFGRGHIIPFDDPLMIEIIPDWERVIDLIVSDKKTQKNWFWLVLPVRFGYPASSSPFAGLIKHADTGNLSVFGPTYSEVWNRIDGTANFDVYIPHKLSSTFPLDWQSNFSNKLGFFNLIIPTLQNIPPFSLVTRVLNLSYNGFNSRQPVFYPNESLPSRFVGISFGVFRQKIPGFLPALSFSPEQISEIQSLINKVDPDYQNFSSSRIYIAESVKGWKFQLNFHLGDRLTSENTLQYSIATMGENINTKFREDPFKIRTKLNLWEFMGSFRYNLKTGTFQPYIKVGYGWTWFRTEDVSVEGQQISPSNSPWVRKPSLSKGKNLLPNSWHYGLGIEVLPVKSSNGLDIGLKLEYLRNSSSFEFDLGLSDWRNIKKGKLRAHTGNISLSLTLNY